MNRPASAIALAALVLAPALAHAAPPAAPFPADPRDALAAWMGMAGAESIGARSAELALAALSAADALGPDAPERLVRALVPPPDASPFEHLRAATALQAEAAPADALPPLVRFPDLATALAAAYVVMGVAPPADASARAAEIERALPPEAGEALARLVGAFVLEAHVARVALHPEGPDLALLAAARVAVAEEVLAASQPLSLLEPPACPPDADPACARLVWDDCGYVLLDARPRGDAHGCHYALSIDLFGDDTYTNNAGGASADRVDDHTRRPLSRFAHELFYCVNVGPCLIEVPDLACLELDGRCEPPVALLVDVMGNDRYVPVRDTSRDLPRVPRPPWNPSFGALDETNGDLIALNGGGYEGIGALFDLDGDDVYDARVTFDRAASALNGASVGGSGLLVDLRGNDLYHAQASSLHANGAGSIGLALLLDACGNDTYEASFARGAANGAGGAGHGALVDLCGDDRYDVQGGDGSANGAASGGSGLLVDLLGDDEYAARLGVGRANGAGSGGVGVLLDGAGADLYDATIETGVANGGGAIGVGLLVDAKGNNTFRVAVVRGGGNGAAYGFTTTLAPTLMQSITRDEVLSRLAQPGALGVLLAGPGNDTYEGNGITQGAASLYGAGALLDVGGRNAYDAGPATAPSSAGGCAATYDPTTGAMALGDPAFPRGRTDAAAAWDGARAWLAGGRDAIELDDVLAYAPAADEVVAQARMPVPRYGAVAFHHEGHVYVLGGHSTQNITELFNSPNLQTPPQVLRVNTTTAAVETTSDALAIGRYHAAAVWTGSTAYVFGGIRSNDSMLRETLAYTPGSDPVVLAAELPVPLAGASAVHNGTHAFLFGGRTALFGPGAFRDHVYRFDFATGSYTLMGAKLPTPRMETGAAYDGARYAYVVGGRDASGPLDEIVRYDTWTDTTSVVARLPTPRVGPAALWTGSALLVLGGGEECLRGFAQGAGHAGSVGLLVDLGHHATFHLRDHTRGQGAGAQGAGILVHEPLADPLDGRATYSASARAAPFAVTGSGVGMRLDLGVSTILGPNVVRDCGGRDLVEPFRLTDLAQHETPFGLEDVQVHVCAVDESTSEPILHPTDARAMGDIEKPPCSTVPGCPAATAPLDPEQRAWMEADHLEATVSGGLSFLDIRTMLPQDGVPTMTHARVALAVHPSADHACGMTGCLE